MNIIDLIKWTQTVETSNIRQPRANMSVSVDRAQYSDIRYQSSFSTNGLMDDMHLSMLLQAQTKI